MIDCNLIEVSNQVFFFNLQQMATLGKTFEPVCSQEGKDNVNQPYMWLGIEDPQGSGIWRARINQEILGYTNWDKNEGSEGDTCARMQGNGK